MSKFKVRKDTWVEGILQVEEVLFDLFEDAVAHVKHSHHHGAKVIDEEGRVIHREGPATGESYA